MKTRHERTAHYVSQRLSAFGFDVRREWRPSPTSRKTADVVAFAIASRRPEIVVEVKSQITGFDALDAAVRQVEGYTELAMSESPLATILPLVVAEYINEGMDAGPYRYRALVWSVEMFDYVDRRRDFYVHQEHFLQQSQDGLGRVPWTFSDRVEVPA